MKRLRSLSVDKRHCLLAAGALMWANLPYLVGYLAADRQEVFGGFFVFPQDGFSYLAKMQQGAAGNWLFHLPYTTEVHRGACLYLFYLVLGKTAHALHLPMIGAYHLARLLGSVLLLAGVDQFITRFATTARGKLLSWAMVLLGGGTDWLISALSPRYVAFTSVAPDAFVYSVLFGPPHITAALALLLWLLALFPGLLGSERPVPEGHPRRARNRAWVRAMGLGLLGLVMALARPDYVVILVAAGGSYCLALGLARHRFPGRELGLAFLLGLAALAYLACVVATFLANPAMAAWAAQNPFGTPPLDNVLAGMWLFALPGVLGIVLGRWWQDEKRLMLVAWMLALPLVLYAPLPLQRRMVGGAQVALAVPAGSWLDQHVLPWLGKVRWRTVTLGPVLALAGCLLVSYPFLFGLGAVEYVGSRPRPLFLDADELAALEWLAAREDSLVVMAAEETGNHIPAFSRATPVLGHPIETLAVEQKRADVARFYAIDTPAVERKAILEHYGVDVIWWGPAERRIGLFNPAVLRDHRLGFEHGSVQVWIKAEGTREIEGGSLVL